MCLTQGKCPDIHRLNFLACVPNANNDPNSHMRSLFSVESGIRVDSVRPTWYSLRASAKATLKHFSEKAPVKSLSVDVTIGRSHRRCSALMQLESITSIMLSWSTSRFLRLPAIVKFLSPAKPYMVSNAVIVAKERSVGPTRTTGPLMFSLISQFHLIIRRFALWAIYLP